ncbi:DUF1553 domain-containing protein [Pelagicoccus mobilis]|uniref:DUF1553 domain-containing protein n=1 Tax=Pelagicoccus mobilis TaxID=415221 RepID=A0A934S1I5_9BACT|nr:DUF1553 domain-containing protein [Pelagicoccus mobilis]MBK1880622.1 DUF1553 domain-containing protein [Pelagicoccus mobilis]
MPFNTPKLLGGAFLVAAASLSAEEISFNEDIRPILSDRCFKCHGPDAENQKSEFRLDTFEHATADIDGIQGIVPGNLDDSEFHYRIHTDESEDMMPPPKSNLKLSDREKELLDQWILQGAEYDTHWAFKPLPKSVDVPDHESDWASNEIDQFVEKDLIANDFSPADESPKEKWLRRVTFDLTGLPPTLDELADFQADTSTDAYEKVVDRLLNSTGYAERMTSEWLDVARYSDSNGYQRDRERRVWPWRDWVIDAFDQNMPYDEFVTLQLAGDLLPDAGQDEILPTAFNRIHAHKMEGGIVLEEYRVEYVADRTQTFSAAFLGLTMDCARCHDHKYDPLPTKDYYELSSFFANIEESGLISYFTDAVPTPAMPISTPEADEKFAEAEEEIAKAEIKLEKLAQESVNSDQFKTWLATNPEARLPGLVADVTFDSMEEGKLTNFAKTDTLVTTPENNKLVPGVSGKAIHFTGDDALEIPETGHFTREHPFSASLWIRPNQISERENLFSRGGGADDAASLGYEVLLLDGKLTASLIHFWPGNALRVQAKQPVAAQEWQHVVVTYDGSSKANGISIYLDGKPLELEVIKDHLTRQITQWHVPGGKIVRPHIVLGERYRDRGFKNGQIDEFRMFNRELSSAEALHLYDNKHLNTLLANDPKELSEDQLNELSDYFLATVSPSANQARSDLKAARAKWNRTMDDLPAISIMRETEEPRKAYVLTRGGYDNHGEEVTADTPSALPEFPEDQPRNRLGLAKWLTAPDHPLTARVAVNRYWQMVFGEGLVRTPEDFGSQGNPPTHPELLDWLSRDFVNNGWDLQRLFKKMVLSSTYRQSTFTDSSTRERDPDNIYLSRSFPERLPAEMIRDNALAVSGLLVDKVGGEPVKPYDLSVSFKPMDHDQGEGLYRRSLYTFWKRNAPAPAMVAFDASKRDVCTVKREATSSPLQPLVTLNAPQFVEASRVLGEKLLQKHGKDRKGLINEAFLSLTSRQPDKKELSILSSLYKTQLAEFSENPDEAAALLEVGHAPLNVNLNTTEHAAATIVINAVMNLNESLIQR